MAHKVIVPKTKNYVPNFLKQWYIGNFMSFCNHGPSIYSFFTLFLLFFESWYDIWNMIYAENAPRILNKIRENMKEGGVFN